jgi:hypothetical protein
VFVRTACCDRLAMGRTLAPGGDRLMNSLPERR